MWVCTAAGRLAMNISHPLCLLKEPFAANPDMLPAVQAAGKENHTCVQQQSLWHWPISRARHTSWGHLDSAFQSADQTCMSQCWLSVPE